MSTLQRIVYDDTTHIAHTFRGTRANAMCREYRITEAQYMRLWLAMRKAGGYYKSFPDASWVWDRIGVLRVVGHGEAGRP